MDVLEVFKNVVVAVYCYKSVLVPDTNLCHCYEWLIFKQGFLFLNYSYTSALSTYFGV